jgi:hypothetical protein
MDSKASLATFLVLLMFGLGTADRSHAQEIQEFIEITLTDGSTFVGTILSESETEISFRTTLGLEFTFLVADVRSRRTIRGRISQKGLMKLDPTSSRLFFAATGRPLKKGGIYLANYEIVFGLIAYGVSENVIVSGGTSLFPGAASQLIYIAPKLTLYNKNDRSFAVGVLAGRIASENGGGGIVYGVSTIGPSDRAVSVGAGFLFGGGDVNSTPIILVGLERQLSSKLKVISENYLFFFDETAILVSAGLRFIGGKLTTDLAFVSIITSDVIAPWLPWGSFTYHFGK